MRLPRLALVSIACLGTVGTASALADERRIPPPFAPLEFLVGSWKGQAVPLENPAERVRGWTETHAWAWSFADGQPVGMTFRLDGSKLLTAGSLAYDEARKKYVLKAEPAGAKDQGAGPVVYEGAYDASRKLLTLDRVGAPAGRTPDRLTLRPNANFVRYTMSLERKSPRGTSTTRVQEVGLTKEGETFAAGSSSVERPKCVVTGGAATQTVSFQGKDFPICCSGCRDEFLETPDKYLKKLAAAPAAGADKKAPPARRPRGDDDAFSNDVGGAKNP